MERRKNKVIYISGWGRSGSTLLGSMLGVIEGFHSVGELRYIWERGYIENRLCSCGETFVDCKYWQSVRESIEIQGIDINPEVLQNETYLYTRTRNIFRIVLHWMRGKNYLENTSYKEIISSLYKSICRISRCNILVDTSKFPMYGYLLSQMTGLEVYTIHLIRDPRGCAFSWKTPKKDVDPNSEGFIPPINIFQSSIKWVTMNLAAYFIRITNPKMYMLVKYEDFMEDPEKILENINQLIGLEKERIEIGKNFYSQNLQHIFAGNPSRYVQGKVKLRTDDRWIQGLTNLEKVIIMLVTFPFNLIFGYKFFN